MSSEPYVSPAFADDQPGPEISSTFRDLSSPTRVGRDGAVWYSFSGGGMDEDSALLQLWCAGDDTAGAALLGRRIDAATVDQKLLTRCVRGDAMARERFITQFFRDLDPALCQLLARDGGLQRAFFALDQDLHLLHRWSAGNKGSAEALFERYYSALDRFIVTKVGDATVTADIVQETFKDLTQQHRNIVNFRPYMFKIAANKVKAWFLRRYDNKVDLNTSGISDLPESRGQAPDARAAEHLERKLLLLALQNLPLNQQMLLELYTWEEFSATDVAEILGIQVHTVRHELRRAKQAMRDFLAQTGERVALAAKTSELTRFLADLRENANGLKPTQ